MEVKLLISNYNLYRSLLITLRENFLSLSCGVETVTGLSIYYYGTINVKNSMKPHSVADTPYLRASADKVLQ
jgi:hypothetical protein